MGPEPIKPTSWSFEPKACASNVPDCAICRELNAFLIRSDKIEKVFSGSSYWHLVDQLDRKYGDVSPATGGRAKVKKHHFEWKHAHRQWMSRFDAVYKSLPIGEAVKDLLGDKYEELTSMSWLKLNGPERGVNG